MTHIDDLQRRLNERGAVPQLQPDGRAGPKTAEALERDLRRTYGVPFIVAPLGSTLVNGPAGPEGPCGPTGPAGPWEPEVVAVPPFAVILLPRRPSTSSYASG